MSVTLMVGSRTYALEPDAARWLASNLRDTWTDAEGELADHSARLAQAIDVALEDQDTDPLELCWLQIQAAAFVLHRPGDRPGGGGLPELADAIRRFERT